MKEAGKAQKQTMTLGEILWTVVCGLVGSAGLVMVLLGIVGDYLPVKASENWILLGEASFQSTMKMNYRWFGALLLVASALIGVLYLNYYAKKSDIDEERALRRQQRLQVISQSADVASLKNSNGQVQEVPSTPVPPKKD